MKSFEYKHNMSRENQISDEEKALRIYNALNDYYAIFPDRQAVPSIVITQDWDVFLDYKEEPCDSDFTDYAVLFMEDYEAEEWVYSMDTIKDCIHYIDRELEAAKMFCLDIYGEVPTHEKNLPRDLTYYMVHIFMNTAIALKESKIDDWILEIDLPISEIYLVKKEMRSPSYGGLILHYDPMKFIKTASNGEMMVDVDKVRELSDRIFNSDLTGEFANDDDDEGGDLFRQSLKGLL